jgi:cytochrome c-type biogenesis protein
MRGAICLNSSLSSAVVFFEGLASFLSPCVLPLIPIYITYLTGQSVDNITRDGKTKRTLIWNGLAFVIGFSIIFILLGATATSIGRFLLQNSRLFSRIGGIIVIFFGLFQMDIIPIRWLNYEKRLNTGNIAPSFIGSLLMGMGFSFGWTPCIGPILSSVLIMAGNASTLWQGISLLAIYSLGLGLPFMLIAIFFEYLLGYLQSIYKYMKAIKIVSGTLLIIIGLLMITGRWEMLFQITQ